MGSQSKRQFGADFSLKSVLKMSFAAMVWSITYALCVYPVFTEMVTMNPPLAEHPMSQVHLMVGILNVLSAAVLATIATYLIDRRLWSGKSN